MVYDADAGRLARLAVGLVNLPDEALDPTGLARFLEEYEQDTSVRLTEADAVGLRQVRDELAAVFDTDDVDDAAARINRLLGRAQFPPRLSSHDGWPWHLHVTSTDASWADGVAASTGLGLAQLLAEDGLARLGRCAAPGCRLVFAGGLRNHPRRYCSPSCANRARVAAHRSRRRTATARRVLRGE
jgi:predicted RNA-binding Zn ribbon-like protein